MLADTNPTSLAICLYDSPRFFNSRTAFALSFIGMAIPVPLQYLHFFIDLVIVSLFIERVNFCAIITLTIHPDTPGDNGFYCFAH